MNKSKNIADVRREYGEFQLDENKLPANPMVLFQQWFAEILQIEKHDPTAMVLSTVDKQGLPDSRVVLLKGLEEEKFIFYTNYQSAKAVQIDNNPYVALNFYWPEMTRQVRIRGKVDKVDDKASDAYFASRPLKSQFSAVISLQSQEISNRAVLEKALNELIRETGEKSLVRPKYWGGYQVIADEIEFWQGRDNRLHDRIHYSKAQGHWLFHRLAP